MQELRDIFTKVWPNARVMAAAIGQPYERVRRWRSRGRIPQEVWPVIIEKAALREHFITAGDLLKLNKPRLPRSTETKKPQEVRTS